MGRCTSRRSSGASASPSDARTPTAELPEWLAHGPLPLDARLAGEGRGQFEFPWSGKAWTLPCVDFEGQRLWGMTLRMVDRS